MSDWTPAEAALTIPCASCGAAPGYPCQTRRGKTTSAPHMKRTRPLRDAWIVGYDVGYDDGQAMGR